LLSPPPSPPSSPPSLPPELAGTLAGLPGVEPPPRRGRRAPVFWFRVGAGATVLLLLTVFVAQNLRDVELSFLWMRGRAPLALAMFVAGVLGALTALAARVAWPRRR
jgi:uncharacterized integral membrane protein